MLFLDVCWAGIAVPNTCCTPSFFLQSLGIHQTTNNIMMRIFRFPWMCRPFSHMHCREGEAW